LQKKRGGGEREREKKKLGFGPSFCIIKLNTIQISWQKGGYSLFWILASRGQKNERDSRGHNEGNKFCILDEIKHHHKNFVFCISSFESSWHFAFFGELNTP
jgi:hypothetical protein